MKIYYICYENLDVPAAWTTHVIEVVNHLADLGHSVTLFAPRFSNTEINRRIRLVLIDTISVRFLREYMFYFCLFQRLQKYCRREFPDILYVREMGVNISPYCIGRLFRIPVVVEMNGLVTEELKQAGYPGWKLWLVRLFRWYNLRFADRLIAVTQELERRLRQKYHIAKRALATIENGVNIQLFQPTDTSEIRTKLQLPANAYILVFTGSFYPHHGLFDTLRIFKAIKHNEPNVKLLLVGDGSLKNGLKIYAENNGLADDIIWAGRVPMSEIPAYISAADACVLLFNNNNGHVTGRSIKILEYMSCARPVIVSETPELSHFVAHHQCGIAVNPSDQKRAGDKILQLLNDDALKDSLGQSGRREVEEHYQWAHTAKKIEKLCLSLIHEK